MAELLRSQAADKALLGRLAAEGGAKGLRHQNATNPPICLFLWRVVT